jgi:hypothetical protein
LIGTKTWRPLPPEVFGKETSCSASSAALTRNAARAASANSPLSGSRSKQIQSGFRGSAVREFHTWIAMQPMFAAERCVSRRPPTT